MRRLALGLSLMGCLLAPATSLALGLGSMNVRTTLNQPLQADIGLVGTSPDELPEVNARLASFRLFEQVGIPRPDYLDKLQFKVVRGSNGASYIQVTTRDPVKQPFLDFLLEVNWPGGRLVREYTVLLNPPNYLEAHPEVATRAPTVTTAPIVKRSPAPAKKPEVAAPAPAPATPTPMATAAPTPAAKHSPTPAEKSVSPSSVKQSTSKPAAKSSASASKQYKVRRGDTLLRVAERMRPNKTVSLNQVMIALLRANSDAFIHGNINGLKQGYVLRMPPAGTIAAIGKTQADAQVHQQNSLWHEYASHMAGHTVAQSQLKTANHSGLIAKKTSVSQTAATATPKPSESSQTRLKIMGTKPSSSGSAKGSNKVAMAGSEQAAKLKHELALAQEGAASNKQKVADLESRVQALQGIVNKQQSLIDLKNQQLSNLQKELTSSASAKSAKAGAIAPSSTIGKATAVAPSNAAAKSSSEKAASGSAAIAAPGTMAVAPATTVATPVKVKPEHKVVPKPKPPIRKPVIQPKPAPQSSLIGDLMGNPNMLMAGGGVGLLLLALLWLVIRRSARSRAAGKATPAGGFATDPELGMDVDDFDVDLDDDEGVQAVHAEPEVPAYAAALDEEPPVASAPAKKKEESKTVAAADDALAEADVYIAYGLYQQAEDALRKALEAEPDRNDYRAKLIECYFGAKNFGAFESEAKQLHENLSHPETDPLWIKTATLGKELIPDNPLFTGTDTGELTSADVLSGEQPLGNELNLGGHEFGGHGDAENFAPANSSDAEVLELGDLDLGDDLGDSELETIVGDETDDLAAGLNFEESEPLELGRGAEPAASEKDSLGGGMDFSLDDLDLSSELQAEEVGGDKDETGFESLDMDSGAFGLDSEAGLSLDDLPEPDAGLNAEAAAQADDFPLSASVGEEVATKLDLAKAYIDMGDSEGARSALEEVVAEGNDAQKKEAQELLNRLA